MSPNEKMKKEEEVGFRREIFHMGIFGAKSVYSESIYNLFCMSFFLANWKLESDLNTLEGIKYWATFTYSKHKIHICMQ